MARVDFYLLQQSGTESRFAFACRLAEKAYRLENTVHIHAASDSDVRRLDDLLWTFRDGSFVPHEISSGAESGNHPPVRIASGSANVSPCDLLINLCDEIPECAEAFPRVAELVSSDDSCKQESRKRFAAYRDKGHTLETHNV
jgi:DNA polymerase-3 subunit chi